MLVVLVHVEVKPGCIDAFKQACINNVKNSLKEPGVARFDVIQQLDHENKFILVEAYRDKEAAGEHKKTKHYARWRDAVEAMMAKPRYSVKYDNIYPLDGQW